jgi:protein tyrosine phosphatase
VDQKGLVVFLTDDSRAERNALKIYWPEEGINNTIKKLIKCIKINDLKLTLGIYLLCTFHFLQAFWRWLHDSKHHIKNKDRAPIMEKVKKSFIHHHFRDG